MREEHLPQMHEEGRVRALRGGLAQVETLQTEACSHCSAKSACHGMGGEKQRLVWALNEAQAKEGDKVLLALPRRGVLGAGFLVYIVPILAMILGASLGKAYAPAWGWEDQSGAVVLGLASLVVVWFILHWVSRKLAGRKELTVRLVRILKDDQPGACTTAQ